MAPKSVMQSNIEKQQTFCETILRNTKFDYLIPETRQLLKETLINDPKYIDTYYNYDLERAMINTLQVRRFLHKASGSVDSAVKLMISSFQWIKNLKLRELTDSDFPIELYLVGIGFIYEKDLAGRPTMYVRIKNQHLSRELTKSRFLFYLALKIDEMSDESGLTVICDLKDISLANVDIELSLSLASMRDYLPYSGALIITIDLPFIARAAFNLVKYALPAELRELMVNIERKDLVKYVDINNIPQFLGGKCKTPCIGPNVVPNGSIWAEDYAKNVLNLNSNRIERITKLCSSMIEDAKKEPDFDVDRYEKMLKTKSSFISKSTSLSFNKSRHTDPLIESMVNRMAIS